MTYNGQYISIPIKLTEDELLLITHLVRERASRTLDVQEGSFYCRLMQQLQSLRKMKAEILSHADEDLRKNG